MSKLLEEDEVFKCCRFNVVKRKYEREDGVKFDRYTVNPGDAVIILPVTENGEIVFIEQMRESVGKICLELPAGMIDSGEEPIEAAKRELEEETGIVANSLELLIDGYPSAGYTSEKIHIYLARDFSEGKIHLDETEEITIAKRIPIEEALKLISENYFEEINVIVAILTYYNKYFIKK
ncbi:MAG: NUDIX hydrolase [Clostridia bacterium]|nr:NUDIX hydrolase [Clostridia bacterium]